MTNYKKVWNALEEPLLSRDFDAARKELDEHFDDGVPEDATWDFGQEEAQGNRLVAQGLVQWDDGDHAAAAKSFETLCRSGRTTESVVTARGISG